MSNQPRREAKGSESWWRTNQGVGVVLTVLLGAFLIQLLLSDWVHRDLRDGFKLGFFPVVGVIAMLLCTVALLFDSHRREVEADLGGVHWKSWVYCVVVLAGCYVYFETSQRFGFLLASPVFLFVLTYFLGVRPWTSALAAGAIMTVAVYGVFRMLGITLAQGFLPF